MVQFIVKINIDEYKEHDNREWVEQALQELADETLISLNRVGNEPAEYALTVEIEPDLLDDEDPLTEYVMWLVKDQQQATVHAIMNGLYSTTTERTTGNAKRISRILFRAGWQKVRVKEDGFVFAKWINPNAPKTKPQSFSEFSTGKAH